MLPDSEKLAVLMPVFDGGENFRESVFSCARSGLAGSQYDILVVDNCSRDGCTDQFPTKDSNGASIYIHRNATNLGRVGNWNRSVELALERDYRYITFLFGGDSWIAEGSLPRLFRLVRETDAAIGLSPFTIADEKGRPKRSSRRFYTPENSVAIANSRSFLSTLVNSGLFPLGPLQANIYRISPDHYPKFDEKLPSRTDVVATLEFIAGTGRPVAIVSNAFFQWREHAGRFHASMGPRQTVRDYLETFHGACAGARIPVDYGRAKTRVLLNSARLIFQDASPFQWPGLLLDLFQQSRHSPYKSNAMDFLEVLWLRFVLRRRLLQFT